MSLSDLTNLVSLPFSMLTYTMSCPFVMANSFSGTL